MGRHMKTKKRKNKRRVSKDAVSSPLLRESRSKTPRDSLPFSEEKSSVVIWSQCPRFPDFGKEVRRSSPIHEFCYDCKRFVHGCKGRSPKVKFHCKRVKWYKRVEAK
jgi:hypothetical protein